MATDELDILADTTNEATGLEDTTDYTEALTILANAPDTMGLGIQQQLNENRPDPVVVGEDGQFYRNNAELTSEGWVSNIDYSEPVYYFTQPLEDDRYNNYGEASDDFSRNYSQGNYYTKDEIKAFWDGDKGTGMDLFKEQNPNLDFDTYFNFVQESSSLYTGNINATYADNQEAVDALAAKYGIATTYTDDDGQVWGFNGSGLSQTRFVDTSIDFGGIIMSVAAGAMTGGLLAGPLTTALGSVGITGSAATAAVQGISSAAAQLITTGEVDLKQALISAATGYAGDKLGKVLAASTEVDGVIGEISNTVSSTVDTLKTLTETGMPIVDAAIKAGGMSMLTQLVSTGDIDLKEAAVAAVIGGGIEAFNQFKTDMNALGVPEDEYMADLAEYEEFQQAAINADIKDPFLNPNYTTVGEGLMVNSAGNVFNYAGDNLGNMSTLDTNNDGKLSGVDLQEIEVTATRVSIYDNLDPTSRHYVDAEGNIRTDVRAGDYGKYYASDGTEVFEARYDNGKLLVADETGAFNTIRNVDGSVYGTYNPETGEWVGTDGKPLDSSVGEYMATKSGVLGPSQIDTGMTKTEYEQMSGPELFDDYFVQRGSDGQLTLSDTEMQELVNRFGSGEAFEEWLQNPDPVNNPGVGYGVNYSAGTGYVFEANVDTSEGIYGFMGDDSTIASLFDADELSDTQYFSAQYVTPKTQVTAPWVEPEPVDPTKVTDVTDVTKTTQSGGQEVANNTADAIATATNTNQINETIASAGQQGASASQLANAINAAVAAGTISAEQAAAALGAIDVTASVDPSTTSITTGAGGMLTSGGDVTTTTGGTVTTGGGTTGTETTGGGDTGTETTGGGDTVTKTYSTAITGALGGAITTIAGTGDPGTGTPGPADPGTGGPETGGPPGTEGPPGKDGKDGRDGVSSRPFTPYEFKGLSYQTPTIQEIVQNPNIDYTASLDRIINKGMFGNLI